MTNINGNVPNIKNSKSIDQLEIQNAKQNMNSAAGKNMILGAELTSNITNSVPTLNSSTSVESQELQNVKKTVQESGNQINK